MSELLSLIVAPCTADNPMGGNINHDPDFDAIKTEVGKLSGVNYELIEEKSRSLLSAKAKDLRVMAFLSLALLRREAWEEYADLFAAMAQLAEKNFDALQPERPRAREQALRWLSEERYQQTLLEKKPQEQHYEHVVRLVAALKTLKTVLEQKFPESSPFPVGLLKEAQAWESALKPKPQPAEAQPRPSAPASEAMETPKQAQALVRKPARFLCEKEPTKPMGFRLMRVLRWDVLEAVPPSEGGRTQLPGPSPQQRQFFETTLMQKDWKTLHEKAEEAFGIAANHVWLDLQRYSICACKEMGAAYDSLVKALSVELAIFVRRLPSIVDLNFADGTPFCDATTKSWIQSEVLTLLAGSPQPPSPAPSGIDSLEEEKQEIEKLAASGQLEKALARLQAAIRGSSNEEQNFRRCILLAHLLLKAKQPDIALSIYESLDERIGLHHLDCWCPDLAVEAWAGFIQAIRLARPSKPQNVQVALSDKHNTILRKLSQIDPVKAIELNK